jgi:hypothetical protein
MADGGDYLLFRKTLSGLKPADEGAEEALRKVPLDKVVAVKIKRPRNLGHHRKFFALLKIVYENQEVYASEQALLAAIKIATGHCTPIQLVSGQKAFIPSSISFAAMDQAEFEAFWEKVVTLVCTKIIPNLNREDLEAEIMTMVS